MARSNLSPTHSTSKSPTVSSSTKDVWHAQKTSEQSGKIYSTGKGGYAELPPGPENFIVRTPYPLPPSKEDKSST